MTSLFCVRVSQDLPLFEPMAGLEDPDSLESSLADVGFGAMTSQLVADDPWKDFSDGSDSGIDCTCDH